MILKNKESIRISKMKKFLGIVVLGFLWCNASVAGEMNLWEKKMKV